METLGANKNGGKYVEFVNINQFLIHYRNNATRQCGTSDIGSKVDCQKLSQNLVLFGSDIVHTVRLYIFNFQSGTGTLNQLYANIRWTRRMDTNSHVVMVLFLLISRTGFFWFISNFTRWSRIAYTATGQTVIAGETVAAVAISSLRFTMGRSLCK